jgi:hypothetical protein
MSLGRSKTTRSRSRALAAYYEAPNTCDFCGGVVRAGEKQSISSARKQKYCSVKCNAESKKKPPRKCPGCGGEISSGATLCFECNRRKSEKVPYRTLGEVYARCKNYTSYRARISNNARKVYRESGRSKDCAVCGYSYYTEICHIVPVRDFPMTAMVADVNDINNLIALCPNHHKEFDDEILVLHTS